MGSQYLIYLQVINGKYVTEHVKLKSLKTTLDFLISDNPILHAFNIRQKINKDEKHKSEIDYLTLKVKLSKIINQRAFSFQFSYHIIWH